MGGMLFDVSNFGGGVLSYIKNAHAFLNRNVKTGNVFILGYCKGVINDQSLIKYNIYIFKLEQTCLHNLVFPNFSQCF